MATKKKQPTSETGSAAAKPFADVEALAELLRRYDLSEIEVQNQHWHCILRRGSLVTSAPAPAPGAAAAPPAAAPLPAPATPAPKAETSDGNVSYITSPFVGTFYRSPGPDSAPFVDAGTRIRKGQVICIVEAMKLMNEIEAEIDGVVLQCLVENGSAVEYGEPLFKIKQG
ncbi:MAG TPA: acetyl-CoA carboxylase biotin carboxyl carrier protein [Polyangia bacterium]|nr:acetyl-CoA carboxylase biotin carboxyl carrier protein [Polyangia bacterium]